MKKFLITVGLCILLTSMQAFAIDLSPKTNKYIRSLALGSVKLRLCIDYSHYTEFRACLKAGSKMPAILQFNSNPTSSELKSVYEYYQIPKEEQKGFTITAIHTDRLKKMILESESINYLEDLKFSFNYSKNFNLWELSKKALQSDANALEHIAVLIQDVSSSKEHLSWLVSKQVSPKEVNLLSQTLDLIVNDLQINSTARSFSQDYLQKYYPSEVYSQVKEDLSPGIYHFYSTAYWAYRLKQLGVSDDFALLHSYGVQLAYELNGVKGNAWPLTRLPKRLEPYKHKDLKTAYWGAIYGISVSHRTSFRALKPLAKPYFFENFKL